jgi:hypothetical protein
MAIRHGERMIECKLAYSGGMGRIKTYAKATETEHPEH